MPDSLQSVTCNLCGANDTITLETRARWGQRMSNVMCRQCGLVYANPRRNRDSLDAFYRSHIYTEYQDASGAFKTRLLNTSREQAQRSIAYFIDRAGVSVGGADVLEIGCGLGDFLHLARERSARVVGIEMEGPYADHAIQERGLTIVRGHVEALGLSRRFDIIAMFHVLEHLENPSATLLSLEQHLKPGGRLFIEVPDIMGPWRVPPSDFLRLEHLYNFSFTALEQLLRSTGYRVVDRDPVPYLLRVIAEFTGERAAIDRAALARHAAQVMRHWRMWRVRGRLFRPYYWLRNRAVFAAADQETT